MNKIEKLLPSGKYFGDWGDYIKIHGFVSAKAEWMDQAKRYLLNTNMRLGWIPAKTKKSKSGIRFIRGGFAVSGEVCATFWKNDALSDGVYICISDDLAHLGILYRKATKDDIYGIRSGNKYIPYDTDSEQFAHFLKNEFDASNDSVTIL